MSWSTTKRQVAGFKEVERQEGKSGMKEELEMKIFYGDDRKWGTDG